MRAQGIAGNIRLGDEQASSRILLQVLGVHGHVANEKDGAAEIVGKFEHTGGMRGLKMDEIQATPGRLKKGFDHYVWLQRNLGSCDVSTDERFQTCFNGF
jgi:hypothetical protein